MPKSHFFGNATATAEPVTDTPAAVQDSDASDAQAAFHDQVRERLLNDAMANFATIAPLAGDGYSAQLRQGSADLTRYLQREQGSTKAGAEMLDPNEYMAGLALGMGEVEVAAAMLKARNIPDTNGMAASIAEDMRLRYRFPYGDGTELVATQNPHAFSDVFSRDPSVCAIVPASAFFPPELKLAGMTHQQNLDFINLHEGWHCKDDQNKIVGITREEARAMEGQDPQLAIGDPVKLAAFATANRMESLADVGAAGDLIRRGADPQILDGIVAWRSKASDTEHMTIGAVQELQRRIHEMGVENFRKLDDDHARTLYNDVANSRAMSPAVAEKIISYMASSDEVREAQRGQAGTDPVMRQAVDFMSPYQLPPKGGWPDAGVRPLTPDEQKIADQVRGYNAEQMLQDRAFSDAHKITPATLVRAYGALQEDLRRNIDRDPGNPLWEAQAVKLQIFVHVTSSLDYVDANARRGVDIMKAEASLSRFSFDPGAGTTPTPEVPETPHKVSEPTIGDAAPNIPAASAVLAADTPADSPPLHTGALRARPRPTPGM